MNWQRRLLTVLPFSAAPAGEAKAPPSAKDYSTEKFTAAVYVIRGTKGFPDQGNQGFITNPAFVLTSAGHGSVGDIEIARHYQDFLMPLHGSVNKYFDEGLSDFEMKPEVVAALAPYKHWIRFEAIGNAISVVYLQGEAAAFQFKAAIASSKSISSQALLLPVLARRTLNY